MEKITEKEKLAKKILFQDTHRALLLCFSWVFIMVLFWLQKIESFLWGAPLLFLLLIVGLYLTFRLKGVQFRYLFYSLKIAFSRHDDKAEGDISQFQALMTALAATIGIGSIAGVATAIAIGGMGSLFWMWMAAFLGMATKYAEAILAVEYRELDEKNEMCGGPMYYLRKGMNAKKLAALFAVSGAVTALVTGNMIQANSVAFAMQDLVSLPSWVSGLILVVFTGLALFGGIKSIGRITSFFVPIMSLFYILSGLFVIFAYSSYIGPVFLQIIRSAFTGEAAVGGFVGSTVMLAVQMGVSRGVFSSEAGLGSSPIAAAAAKTDVPARQALISMAGVFITSFIVCSITGFAIGVTGVLGEVDSQGNLLSGAVLVLRAFEKGVPSGGLLVTISLILFAYSTVLGWAYYGEKCVEYLGGVKTVFWYRTFFTLVLLPGAVASLDVIWSLANILNAFMAFPNLVALFFLASVVSKETVSFDRLYQKESKRR